MRGQTLVEFLLTVPIVGAALMWALVFTAGVIIHHLMWVDGVTLLRARLYHQDPQCASHSFWPITLRRNIQLRCFEKSVQLKFNYAPYLRLERTVDFSRGSL